MRRLLFTTIVFSCALLASNEAIGASNPIQSSQHEALDEFKANMKGRIARHPYFKKLDLAWVWDHEDFLILVQEPTKMEGDYVERVAKLRSADSQSMNKAFRGGLAKEYGVGLRATSPRMTIVILATAGDFSNYCRLMLKSEPGSRRAFYKDSSRLLVLCQTPFSRGASNLPEGRMIEKQERARQIVHAYSARNEALPDPYWLQRGLAQEVIGNNDRDLAKKGVGRASDWSYHHLCAQIQKPSARATTILPFSAFVTMTDHRSVATACRQQALEAKLEPAHSWSANQVFNAQAGALFHYLTVEADDDLRSKMRDFAETAMKGRLKQKPFSKHFEGVDWAAVDIDFWKHVWKKHDDESGEEEVDAGEFHAFLNERSGEEPDAIATPESFSPRGLLDELKSPDERLALAIAAARTGDSERADVILTRALENIGLTDVQRGRLEREQFRVRAWMDLRDRFLQHLIDSGKKLNIEFEGKRLLAAITKLDRGKLIFASNSRSIDTLEARRLDPILLVRKMSDKRSGFEMTWAVAYPLVIGESRKLLKSILRGLDGDEPELVRLTQIPGDYDFPTLLISLAGKVLTLSETTAGGLPQERLALIESCWAEREDFPFIERMKPGLCSLAELELASQFDQLELEELLAGKVERYRDGRIHLRYDFNRPGQLLDWPLDPAPGFHDSRPPTKQPKSYLEISDGKLTGLGEVSRSHLLAFEGPHSMVWRERVLLDGELSSEKLLLYRFSLCSLPDNSYVGTINSVNLELRDSEKRQHAFKQASVNDTRFDSVYINELVHDGEKTLTLMRNRQEVLNIKVNERLSGHPQLWFHSDYRVEIDEIEIVGKVSDASLDRLRRRWVAERLQKMGLER